jgi:hypothetical protein
MDGHKHEELNDDLLEREIEAALDVDPSPEFLARVRTRVARERMEENWAWLAAGRWAAAALAMVAVVVVGLRIARERAPVTPEVPPASASRHAEPGPRDPGIAAPADLEPRIPKPESAPGVIASSNESKPVIQARDVHAPQPPLAEAELLISQDEAAALRQLFTAIANRHFETAALPDLEAALQPPAEIKAIVVEPISLRPLADLEGE